MHLRPGSGGSPSCARTGSLLAAAALSASFLGVKAVERAGLSIPVVFAIVALVGTIGLCIYVLTPRQMAFAIDAATLYEMLPADIDDRLVHLHLVAQLEAVRADNEPLVDALDARFRGASIVVGAGLVMWIAALTVG